MSPRSKYAMHIKTLGILLRPWLWNFVSIPSILELDKVCMTCLHIEYHAVIRQCQSNPKTKHWQRSRDEHITDQSKSDIRYLIPYTSFSILPLCKELATWQPTDRLSPSCTLTRWARPDFQNVGPTDGEIKSRLIISLSLIIAHSYAYTTKTLSKQHNSSITWRDCSLSEWHSWLIF